VDDWERRYRELAGAIWLLPPEEYLTDEFDIAQHVETLEEAKRSCDEALKFRDIQADRMSQ